MNVSSVNSAADVKRAFAIEALADKVSGKGLDPEAARKAREVSTAAKQFEAIIVRQLLSPAIEPLMSGGVTGGEGALSGGNGVYGYLLTDVLAGSLTQGGGLGFSKLLEKQLMPKDVALAAQKAAAAYRAGEGKSP